MFNRLKEMWWLPTITGVFVAVIGLSTPVDAYDPNLQPLFACDDDLEDGWDEHTCLAHLSWADITWHFSDNDPGDAWPSKAKTAVTKASYAWESGHALNLIEDGGSVNHIYYGSVTGPPVVTKTSYNSSANHIDGFQMDVPSTYNNDASLAHGGFSQHDLFGAATHEWGHVIGLDHVVKEMNTDAEGGHQFFNSSPTGDPLSMCPTAGTECAGGGHTERRTLSGSVSGNTPNGDIGGRCHIYSTNHNYSC